MGDPAGALSTLPAAPSGAASPLWLLDLIAGVTTAHDSGDEHIEGQDGRHIVATASLAEASARQPEGMPSPAQNRFEDLLSLPVELWLDDHRLRRIRFVSEQRTDTLALDEFGVDTEQLDWSRLPTFRT